MIEIKNEIVAFDGVSFTYKHRSIPSVDNVNMRVDAGEFLLLTGATGCGKSTLLKMLNGLIPHESGGCLKGEVTIDGVSTRDLPVAAMSRMVGMVFQNPDDQVFSTTVFAEVAFVLENMGMEQEKIEQRVAESLRLTGLSDKTKASVHSLSGGQKQRLALAAVLAARPQVLALDEPISQLDPQGAAELMQVLQRLNADLGITIIIVEHRLHEVLPLCSKVAIMASGSLLWQGDREEAYRCPELFNTHGLRLPQPVTICQQLGVTPSTDIKEAVAAIQQCYMVPRSQPPIISGIPCELAHKRKDGWKIGMVKAYDIKLPSLRTRHLTFQYDGTAQPLLTGVDFSLYPGEFVALMGSNGAGKSTLLHLLGGLLKPKAGSIEIWGRKHTYTANEVGVVLQNPDFMLFNSTVQEEVTFALQQQGRLAQAGWTEHCQDISQRLGINGMEKEFPLALSRGQRLRVALAAVLASRPSVLLLDEPTTGQDIGHIEDIVGVLQAYAAQGGSIVFCTHDTEVAARFADRVVVMGAGEIVADANPASVFQDDAMLAACGLKAPAAMLLSRALYGGAALRAEEVVSYVQQGCLGSYAGRNAVAQH